MNWKRNGWPGAKFDGASAKWDLRNEQQREKREESREKREEGRAQTEASRERQKHNQAYASVAISGRAQRLCLRSCG